MVQQISQIVIIDNGAHAIKAGLNSDKTPRIIPNCITKVKSERRRPFIGDQLEECKDYSGLFYILPFVKGYLINWDIQRQIWDYVFRTKLKLPTDSKHRFSQVGLIITEPVYNFRSIRENMIEILFEEYGFGEILICSAAQLAAFNYYYEENINGSVKKETTTNNSSKPSGKATKEIACLVVDSGFSFTHIVPFVEGHKLLKHTKRIDIGGKTLTNHLKEIISYRQLNVLDETYVINQMKEDCCYVSTNFWKDLEMAALRGTLNTNVRDYILPDYINFKRGFIYEKEKHQELVNANEHQRIRMNNERFQVPELLFNPGDINIDQIGISHSIIHAVSEFNPNFNLNSAETCIEPVATISLVRDRADIYKDIDSDEDEDLMEEDETETKEDEEGASQDKQNGDDSIKMNGTGTSEESEEKEDLSMYDDENMQSHLYNNILLIGGSCSFSHFKERLFTDIRSNVADILNIRVKLPDDPSVYAWQGGHTLCYVNEKGNTTTDLNDCLFHKFSITRAEYEENGLSHCCEKFANLQLPTFAST